MAGFTRRDWLKTAGAGLLACLAGPAWAQAGAREPGGPEEGGEDMIAIPAGKALIGTRPDQAEVIARTFAPPGSRGYDVTWLSGEVPQVEVQVAAFAIDRYPVTNRQYAEFCKATGYAPRMHWGGPEPPARIADHPVVYVNLADAQAYAKWAGKRLPTEAEWQKAARGEKGLLFPWGDEFDADACCWGRALQPGGPATDPVSAHPRGASPYGVMDLCGNAAEWCADGPGPGAAYVKGGCWLTTSPFNLRPAARNMSGFANNALDYIGFRCAKEVG